MSPFPRSGIWHEGWEGTCPCFQQLVRGQLWSQAWVTPFSMVVLFYRVTDVFYIIPRAIFSSVKWDDGANDPMIRNTPKKLLEVCGVEGEWGSRGRERRSCLVVERLEELLAFRGQPGMPSAVKDWVSQMLQHPHWSQPPGWPLTILPSLCPHPHAMLSYLVPGWSVWPITLQSWSCTLGPLALRP